MDQNKVEKLIQEIKPDISLKIIRPDIKQYLIPEALELSKNEIKSTLYQKRCKTYYKNEGENQGRIQVFPCIYASKCVPINESGGIDETYIKRWANFLNTAASIGLWKFGVLELCGVIQLIRVDISPEKAVLFSFIFTDLPKSNKELNDIIGCNVFLNEGEIETTLNWDDFPF